jgi:hypothetical protein
MLRLAAIAAVAIGLAACGAIDTMVDGFKHMRAVESNLEMSTGVKPSVGFNWSNGRLLDVTVTFPRLLEDKPLGELAATVRAAVEKEFTQKPENIVLAFSLGKSAPGKSARG